MKCPKCSGPMEEGFLHESFLGGTQHATWVEGKPEWGAFGIRTADKKRWKVTGHRCRECGYLELYAQERSY